MPRKPVVFIPGFPASELRQTATGRILFPPSVEDLLHEDRKRELVDLLVGPDNPPGDVVAGDPIRDVLGIAKQAESLYDLLRDNRYGYTVGSGDNFRPVGWDWRKGVDDVAVQTRTLDAIAELRQKNGGVKVVVIAHSTGTLVLRRLLEIHPEVVESIDQLLTFGGTWAGNVVAIRSVVDPSGVGLWPARLSAEQVGRIVQHARAAYDLFPPDPARTDLTDRASRPLNLFVRESDGRQSGPLVDLSWIPAGPDHDFMRVLAREVNQATGARTSDIQLDGGRRLPSVTNVVGWGIETEIRCILGVNGNLRFERGKEGDGTSALASASWLRGDSVRTFFLPIGVYPTSGIPKVHARIWDSPPVLELFDQVLLDRAPSPFVCAAADNDEMIDARKDVTLRITAQDGKGDALPNAEVLLSKVTSQPLSFQGRRRMNAVVPRSRIRPDGQGLFRFEAEISWGTPGDRHERQIVVLLQS